MEWVKAVFLFLGLTGSALLLFIGIDILIGKIKLDQSTEE